MHLTKQQHQQLVIHHRAKTFVFCNLGVITTHCSAIIPRIFNTIIFCVSRNIDLSFEKFFRIFIAFTEDKCFQIFSDTQQRCQPLSAPTPCTFSVLSLLYLDEIDEIVAGGVGRIQRLKVNLNGKLNY